MVWPSLPYGNLIKMQALLIIKAVLVYTIFALEVTTEEALHAAYKKVADYPGVKVKFEPELLHDGPAKHCIFYEPSGIRMEFIWAS